MSEYVRAPLLDALAGLDGLTRDASDRLYAAAYLGGAVWRVSADRSICALARGLPTVAMVAIGAGGDFPSTSLYAVTQTGFIVELPNAIR